MFSLPLQYLNVKLNDISVPDPDKYPHMVCTHIAECISLSTHLLLPESTCLMLKLLVWLQLSVRNCFIRGSVVRYVQLPAEEVDTVLLQDATRKDAVQGKQPQTAAS